MADITYYPIVDSTSSQVVAESDDPFMLTVTYGPGDTQVIPSLHDGLTYFATADVPPAAQIEVR